MKAEKWTVQEPGEEQPSDIQPPAEQPPDHVYDVRARNGLPAGAGITRASLTGTGETLAAKSSAIWRQHAGAWGAWWRPA